MVDPNQTGGRERQARFKRQVDAFLAERYRATQSSAKTGDTAYRTMAEMMRDVPLLPEAVVDDYFLVSRRYSVSEEMIERVRERLHDIRRRVNRFSPEKRFFILETIDFFRNSSYIGRLLPSLLELRGAVQKRELLEFLYGTFATLNRNVETIISSPDLFDKSTLHIEQGSLYAFSSDMSRLIIGVFQEGFVGAFTRASSSIDVLQQVIKSGNGVAGLRQDLSHSVLVRGMRDEVPLMIDQTLAFVEGIQTHAVMYLYARKRHAYYSQFLSRLTLPGRFKGVDPADVSKIYAGCLLTNGQLQPSHQLIQRMLQVDQFAQPQTQAWCHAFVQELTPSTIYRLIHDVRRTLLRLGQRSRSPQATNLPKPGKKWRSLFQRK